MKDNRNLGIILGCSLGGAALLFIIILILVCLCSRKQSHHESNNSTIKNNVVAEEEGKHNFSVQQSGLPPVQQSQFIRTGSQQWKGNISLTSSPPNGSSNDQLERNLQTDPRYRINSVNYEQQQIVPWYLRTLGRARHFLQHKPITYSSKRESGEQLVDARYTTKPTDLKSGPNTAYALSSRPEVPSLDKEVNSSTTLPVNAHLNYGSQAALLPNDYIASASLENNRLRSAPAAASNPAYITGPVHSPEQRGVIRNNADFLKPYSNQPGQISHAGASYQKYFQGQYSSADNIKKRDDNNRDSSTDLWDDASTQLSLPRPQVIKRESNTSANLINRDRIPSIMPPSGKHPTRPDTPTYDPHRKNGPASKAPQKDVTNQQPSAGAQGLQPSSPNQAKSTTEEKKIGDAFKFLDDMEE